MGAESRRQTLLQRSNSDPALASSVNYTGIKGVPSGVTISNFTNIGAAKGAANVNEGYLEFAAPIVRDLPLVQSFELNGAARYTEYSTSGSVTTWKLGGSGRCMTICACVRPSPATSPRPLCISCLPAPRPTPQPARSSYRRDQREPGPADGRQSAAEARKGRTIVAGFVYTPGWLPGFTTQLDYYHIRSRARSAHTNTVQQIRTAN
jgi:hypothetical protein